MQDLKIINLIHIQKKCIMIMLKYYNIDIDTYNYNFKLNILLLIVQIVKNWLNYLKY